MAKSEKFHSSPRKNLDYKLITSVKGFNFSKSPGPEIVKNSHKLFLFKFCFFSLLTRRKYFYFSPHTQCRDLWKTDAILKWNLLKWANLDDKNFMIYQGLRSLVQCVVVTYLYSNIYSPLLEQKYIRWSYLNNPILSKASDFLEHTGPFSPFLQTKIQ